MLVQNIIPGQTINPVKLERARELRREMTSAEKMKSKKNLYKYWLGFEN